MNKDINQKIHAYDASSVDQLEPLKHMFYKTSMYLGSVENPQHTAEEAIMNSLDEVLLGVATEIWVTYHDDGSLSVKDNGRGMPPLYDKKFKMPVVRALLTLPNTGKAFGSTSPGSSQNGIGMKATTATSDWLEVNVYRDGYKYYDRYELIDDQPGVPVVKLNNNELPKEKIKANDIEHGTEVRWLPSTRVWDSIKFDWKGLKELLHQLTYLNSGLTVHLLNEKNDDNVTYYEEGGIASYIKQIKKDMSVTEITPIFSFKGTYNTGKKIINAVTKKEDDFIINANIALCWSDNSVTKQLLFTNNVPNPLGGTPIKGFNAGIARLINKYAKELNLTKDTIEQRDILPGLILIIDMADPAPKFDGQTKKIITSVDAKNALNSIVFNQAQLQFDRSIETIKNVIKLALQRAELRKKEESSKVNLKSKQVLKTVSEKLSASKKHGIDSEMFIVEGDSAAGTLIRERDTNYQAIMAIRGKIINTYKATLDKSMANVELAVIFAALGAGIGNDFDITKCNYGKIIIATDMDPDGAQIADLLLTVIAKFAPDLIRQGYVYRAISPLFVNTLKNKKEIYTYSEKEQEALLKTPKRAQIVDIARNKGLGELEPEQVATTLIDPSSRRLLKYEFNDEAEAYDTIELFMGKDSNKRKEIFFDSKLYDDGFL